MPSLHTIPEPSVAYRPSEDEVLTPSRPATCITETSNSNKPQTTDHDAQVGGLTWLIVLIVSGLAIRLVMCYLGPFQDRAEPISLDHAWLSLISNPAESNIQDPLYALLGWSIHAIGLPVWSLIVIQSALSLIAIPASYIVAHRLTGRRAAGLVAAAIMAFHPGILTGAISFNAAALAGALVALGWGLLCYEKTRGVSTAWLGAGLLGLAGLSAPFAIAAAAAAAMWSVLSQPIRRSLPIAITIALLGIAPPLAWGYVHRNAPSAESVTNSSAEETAAHPTLWAALSTPSLEKLGTQLHVDLAANGTLLSVVQQKPYNSSTDARLIDRLGDGWLLLNTLIWVACVVSFALLLMRHRWATCAALATAALWIAITGLPHTEAQQLPMILVWAVAATGILAVTPPPRYTAEEREQMQIARQEKRNAKLDAKLEKHKATSDIYNFDRRRTKREPKTLSSEQVPTPSSQSRPI